ncbi:MAG TPA: PPC domain-containing protein [Tepidisphaeraceae bacterium]|nr:PPC domain-containing protein [Tepidisphaeraceae bacterium]
MTRTRTPLLLLTLIALGTLPALAASPALSRIVPRGAQRGTEAVLTFTGQRLSDTLEILFYEPGITVTKIEPDTKTGTKATVTVKIAPDARLGEYGVRLRTGTGVSEFRTFWVGRLPIAAEKEPNSDFKSPQPIDLNVTVQGTIENEDQDFFVVTLKKGQRVTAEIEGMRLAGAMFDPYLAILDENRFELTAADDTALLKQDTLVSIVAPKDGKYVIQVRDSSFGGSGDSYYRMHVGTFPRPRVAYPLGGPAGEAVSVKFLGDAAGPFSQTFKLPAKADAHFDLYAEQDGQAPPSGNPFRVSEFPNVLEAEPNDTNRSATVYAGPLPVAFNGIITADPHESPAAVAAPAKAGDPKVSASASTAIGGDSDFFKFKAQKGQLLEINVYARRLRTPLDPVLTVYGPTGNQVATNDDTNNNPDAYARLSVPADGEYTVRVRDHLKGGSDLHAYRVEITPVAPSISLIIPQYTPQYSQERQAVTVHKGNKYATLMRIARTDVPAGPVKIECPQLPAGVTMRVENVEPGVDTVPVLFEATETAKVVGSLVEMKATPADPKLTGIASSFRQVTELVTNGNQASFYTVPTDKMALAVAEPTPYKLSIVPPKVPLVQGGEMKLKVVAERLRNFDGPIVARLLFKPPGIEGVGQVEIPAGKTEAEYVINASDTAPLKTWQLVLVGSADPGNGINWVSSDYCPLEVAAPFLTGKITNATVEQGNAVKITADLDAKTKWDGKAKIELVGLPSGGEAKAKEISADDKKIEFEVTTLKSTPAAVHNGLFLKVTVTQNGEPIQHAVARGGQLRVDAPLGKDGKPIKPAAPAATPAKPKTDKPAK